MTARIDMNRRRLFKTMREVMDDLEQVAGREFVVDTYVGDDDGVPIIGLVVAAPRQVDDIVPLDAPNCGLLRMMTTDAARKFSDLLKSRLGRYSPRERAAIVAFADMLRETADVADAGGVQ